MLLPTISNSNLSKISVSAPGKLHLIGEHAVVYGQPAIIAAVNKRSFVSIGHPGGQIPIVSQGDSIVPLGLQNDTYVNICINESFKFFKKPKPKNFSLSIKTEIPIGSGMGSSASIAVVVAGFISKIVTGKIDKKNINTIAFACETYVHGTPSGGDNTVCTYGGLIWYQSSFAKASEDKKQKIITPLHFLLSEKIKSQFFIINTGRPLESTKEMVALVSAKSKEQRVKKIFSEQGELTYTLLNALKNNDKSTILHSIILSERNLEEIGAVSGSTKKLIREIEKIGAAAKICGAGGIKKASGIVLVFHNNFDAVNTIAKKFSLKIERISLGEKGVRQEL